MQLALRGSRIHRDRLSYGENASWRMLAMTLQDFIRKYPPTGPRRPATNADELRQLGPDDGVLLLTGAPAAGPTGQPDGAQGRHLWVFRNSRQDRKSTRLNSSHGYISYAVFCLKKKKRSHV